MESRKQLNSAKDIENWIVHWIENKNQINVSPIQIDKPFVYLGLDSLSAVQLCEDLQNTLQFEINPILIWEYYSIEKLSAYLACKIQSSNNS